MLVSSMVWGYDIYKGVLLMLYSPSQIDLRDDPKTIAKLNDVKEKPIPTEQGQKLAKEVRTEPQWCNSHKTSTMLMHKGTAKRHDLHRTDEAISKVKYDSKILPHPYLVLASVMSHLKF